MSFFQGNSFILSGVVNTIFIQDAFLWKQNNTIIIICLLHFYVVNSKHNNYPTNLFSKKYEDM